MAKKVARRIGAEIQQLWDENKNDPAWRERYNKLRAAGKTYAVAVETATRKSEGFGPSTVTPEGKRRTPKRVGEKPVIAGGGEGGQGKVKRNDLRGATKKAKTRAQGELLVKRVWREATAQAGDSWKTLTYAQKAKIVLDSIPKAIDGEMAIGIVRGLTSRTTGGRGSDDAAKVISSWASERGVRSPSAEITTAKTAGRGGRKLRARRQGKGSEGISEPVSKRGRDMIEGESRTRVSETLASVTKQQQGTTQEANWKEGESDPSVQKRVNELMAADTSNKSRKKKYNRALSQALRESRPDRDTTPRGGMPKNVVFKTDVFNVPVGSKKSKDGLGDPITIIITEDQKRTFPTVGGKPIVYTNKEVDRAGLLTDKVSKSGLRWVKVSFKHLFNQIEGGLDVGATYGFKEKKQKRIPSAKTEFKQKMGVLSKQGETGNRNFTEAALMDAYMAAYEKSQKERNALRDKLRAEGKGKEAIKKALGKLGSPTVREVAEAMGFEPSDRDQFALVRRVRSRIRREKLRTKYADKPEPAPTKGRRTVLRDTGDEQRARYIAAEDRKERKRQTPKAEPAKRVKIMSDEAATRVAKAVVKGEKPSEADLPSARQIRKAQRINREREMAVPKKKVERPFSIRDAALADLKDPKERKAFRTIERLHEAGFKKTQITKMIKGDKRMTPAVRKVAKGLGMINIATMALNFLDTLDNKKKN